ncbi:hypothetical protein E4U41_004731 [Claviceps citrina]|nr:hypothetical protein E4U41_004731 [Claviceps citrina]
MVEPSAAIPALAMTALTQPQPERIHGALTKSHDLLHGQFRSHKILPHPRNDQTVDFDRPAPAISDIATGTTASVSRASPPFQTSSPRTLKHQSRRIGTGPDPPPTPPSYSRVSSGSHSAQPPSPISHDAGIQTRQASSRRPPATPPDHRSPPTPDVTPPQPANRPHALRSLVPDRGCSRNAPSKTAREEPISFENEAATPTENPNMAFSTPSQTTSLSFPIMNTMTGQTVQPQALDFALDRLTVQSEDMYDPCNRDELVHYHGECGPLLQVETEWNVDLDRLVSAGSRKPRSVTPTTPQLHGAKHEVLDDRRVTPKTAIQAVRSMSPKAVGSVKSSLKSSPQSAPRRRRTGLVAPRPEALSSTTESRRSSGLSSHSMTVPSTVIEAVLIYNCSPSRQRTLRHVRKRRELREPSPHGRESSAIERDLPPFEKLPSSNLRSEHARQHVSYASATPSSSAASAKARREVWKAGGIPVVVIPDRSSSQKPNSRPPSLRSSSSRHSRTRSVGSSPSNRSPPPYNAELSFDRRSRWDRSTSVSDRSDQRTMDFPPTIPPRSSSLSAPTSRTSSRTGSLTLETMKAFDEIYRQNRKPIEVETASAAAMVTTATTTAAAPKLTTNPDTHTRPQSKAAVPAAQSAASSIISNLLSQTPRSDRGFWHDSSNADRHDDEVPAIKYSPRTPSFSVISMETNWTAPEVSEALAVRMYPHQNSSVLRINHSAKPQDMNHAANKGLEPSDSHEAPKFTTTSPEGVVTTPEERKSRQEVDSPLRNPRSPPEPPVCPPAINLIPATPSGLTPAEERQVQLGNFFEITAETPARRPSFVRRALSGRRHSISYPPAPMKQPGFLARTFSLSRDHRKSVHLDKLKSFKADMEHNYGHRGDEPAEHDKLHPHWRPQGEDEGGDCDCSSCRREMEDEEEICRYPLVDNRPRPLKRSLSARVKDTFTILPAQRDYPYGMDDVYGPERRTIRRTPSGNLKVMRRRSSDYSLRREMMRPQEERQRLSQGNVRKGFWRGYSLPRRRSSARLRRSSSLGSRPERLPSLTRRWNEKRREKRTQELRQVISGPKEVRDGVGELIQLSNMKSKQADYVC